MSLFSDETWERAAVASVVARRERALVRARRFERAAAGERWRAALLQVVIALRS